MEIVISLDDSVYKNIIEHSKGKRDFISSSDYVKVFESIKNGTPLAKGHERLIDADLTGVKVFEITDMYDSGEYIVYENGKYTKGNDDENETRRVLTFNEALQLTINSIPTVIDADRSEE